MKTRADKKLQVIKLPKADNRYKRGRIVKDNKNAYRGNPDTVELHRLSVPSNAPIELQLNPPLVASKELAEFLKDKL